MEKWGLSWETLHALNPRLIMLRISGYGQTGPKAGEPGFAAIGEAMAGLRYLNGEPGRAPVRAGLSLGDTIAGLHGALGVLLALYERDARGGTGQVIDAALYESIFNLTESLLPEYSVFGAVREPAGAALPGIAPSNAYPCQDGFVLIAGNGDGIYTRLMSRIGREDLARDPALARNDGRVARVEEIDGAIGAWTQARTIDQVLDAMREAGVPAGRIYSIADIAQDPHYRARKAIVTVESASGVTVEMPAVFPLLSGNPGAVHDRAPTLGEDTDIVLSEFGIDDDRRAALRAAGIIG
jgi:formyl-CoA transferase